MSSGSEIDDEGAALTRKGKTSSQPPSPEKKRRRKPREDDSTGQSGSEEDSNAKVRSLFGKLRQQKSPSKPALGPTTSSKGFKKTGSKPKEDDDVPDFNTFETMPDFLRDPEKDNPDHATVLYFTDDPIESLRLRIIVEQEGKNGFGQAARPTTLKGLALYMKAHEESGPGDLDGYKDRKKVSDGQGYVGSSSEEEEKNSEAESVSDSDAQDSEKTGIRRVCYLDWQEKRYTAREWLTLSHPRAPRARDALQSKYASDILSKLSRRNFGYDNLDQAAKQLLAKRARRFVSKQKGFLIASMVENDGFIDANDLHKAVTDSRSPAITPAIRRTLIKKNKKHSNEKGYKVMHILLCAELPADVDHSSMAKYKKCHRIGWQYSLCRIRAYDNGTVDMCPGLSSSEQDTDKVLAGEGDGWHYVNSPSKVCFRFRIEAASEQISKEEEEAEAQKEAAMNLKLPKHVPSSLDFELPPSKFNFRLNVFGTIDKASNFDCSSLYIEYRLLLGEHFQFSPNDRFQRQGAVTQIASTEMKDFQEANIGMEEELAKPVQVAHFGFPIELELLGVENRVGIRWPTLFFQVNSVDMWNLHRIQGYGYCQLPNSTGHTKQTVKCWKPIGSVRSQIKDFFIGGSGGLRDIRMSGVPLDVQGRVLNKYGLRSEYAGDLHLTLNCATSHHKPPQKTEETTSLWSSEFADKALKSLNEGGKPQSASERVASLKLMRKELQKQSIGRDDN